MPTTVSTPDGLPVCSPVREAEAPTLQRTPAAAPTPARLPASPRPLSITDLQRWIDLCA